MSWKSYCKVSLSIFTIPFIRPSSYNEMSGNVLTTINYAKGESVFTRSYSIHASQHQISLWHLKFTRKRYALFIMLSLQPLCEECFGLRFNFFHLWLDGFWIKVLYCWILSSPCKDHLLLQLYGFNGIPKMTSFLKICLLLLLIYFSKLPPTCFL